MRRFAPAAFASCLLCACQDGTLVLDIADAPLDRATSVVVQISEIDLLRTDGDDERFSFSPPRQVDLLDFTGGASSNLLDGQRVPEGDYTGLRLVVDMDDVSQSYVDVDNVRQRLVLADGGDEIDIEEPFTIERRKELALTLDVDLRQSVLSPETSGESYEFEPITRLIRTEDAVTISGTVAPSLVSGSSCTPVVYAFRGHDVDPDDIGSATDVIASAPVRAGTASGALGYAVAFLAAGDYSVALTCDALADDPREDDDIGFSPPLEVSVDAGETATANFQ